MLLGILPGQNHATIENWTFAMVSKLKLGGAGQIVEFKYLVRAALLVSGDVVHCENRPYLFLFERDTSVTLPEQIKICYRLKMLSIWMALLLLASLTKEISNPENL